MFGGSCDRKPVRISDVTRTHSRLYTETTFVQNIVQKTCTKIKDDVILTVH